MYVTAKGKNKPTEIIQWCKTKLQELRKSQTEIAQDIQKIRLTFIKKLVAIFLSTPMLWGCCAHLFQNHFSHLV